MNHPAKRTLNSLADPALLKSIWKRYLRKPLRNPRLQEFELGHDPLEYLPIDWDLDAVVQEVVGALREGTYRVRSPEVIRSAKSLGLTRPLAFLTTEDLLVYKTLVQVSRRSLREHTQPWTSFGRRDPTEPATERETYSWFILWLQQDKRRWEIIASCPYIVITDIANFFPYVPVSGVATHVLNNSNLDEPVVHLLVHMLEGFGAMHLYRRTPAVGLPQDGFDCSRILAHTYLGPLDDEFAPEGLDGRYTRHVDDIVIGVRSIDEGKRAVARAQKALEGLGLYPNATKTEILSTSDIDSRWYRDTNDYLGEVELRYKSGVPEDLAAFEEQFKAHLESANRGRYWSQVVKRFITISRRLHSAFLCGHWPYVLREVPESARHLFDYLSTFELTPSRFTEVDAFTRKNWGLYEDVDLLIHEYVCSAPNADDRAMRRDIAAWALRFARQQFYDSPRRAAAAALTVGKFGEQAQILDLVPLLDQKPQLDHVARRQVAIVLAGARHYTPNQLVEKLPNPGQDTSRDLRFIQALRAGDNRANNMALGLMRPAPRKDPIRYTLRSRCLFLGPLIAQGAPLDWVAKTATWRKMLSTMKSEFRDRAGERWLGF